MNALTDRILARKESIRKRLIDDDNGRRRGGVALREVATLDDWNAERSEIAGCDDRDIRAGPVGRRGGPAGHVEGDRHLVAGQGQWTSARGRLYTRGVGQALEQLLVKRNAPGFIVLSAGKADPKLQHVFWPEFRVVLQRIDQAGDEQCGAADECKAQSELANDQSATQAIPSPGSTAGAFLQWSDEFDFRQLPYGAQAEQNARREDNGSGKEQYVAVN